MKAVKTLIAATLLAVAGMGGASVMTATDAEATLVAQSQIGSITVRYWECYCGPIFCSC